MGGGGLGIVEAMLVNEEIARADASTGWAFMANAFGTGIIAGFLPEEGSRRLYGGSEKAITAGMSAPVGTARKTDGGLVANGRWQFASGSDYATWIGLGVQVVNDSGAPVLLESGSPDARFVLVPRDDVTFIDNWDVTGLVGTGSNDYTVSELFVPEYMGLSTFSTTPVQADGLYYMGLLGLSVAGHTAVATGAMKRALQEVATITDGKRRQGYPVPVSDYPVFHFEFAKADADYRSARAFAFEVYEEAEDYAARNGGLNPELTARVRQAATWAHHACDRVVGFARLWGGTQAFRNPSDLGRFVRDVNVLTQHLLIDNITLIDAGPALLDSWKKR
jgi:alkylation response protein AidB-like acyl-CoA dehydrogenase